MFWPLEYHWSTKKSYKFSKNIEKTQFRRVAQFYTRRCKSHYFLNHPVYMCIIYVISMSHKTRCKKIEALIIMTLSVQPSFNKKLVQT